MWKAWPVVLLAAVSQILVGGAPVGAQQLSADDVRSAILGFDEALSAKRFDDAGGMLAEDLKVSLTDCDGNINRMGLEVFLGLFVGSFEALTSYDRTRADVEVEIDANGVSGTLSSTLTENIVGDDFEVTGVSRDRTVVEKREAGLVIVQISSETHCP